MRPPYERQRLIRQNPVYHSIGLKYPVYTFLEKPALLLRGDSRGRNDVVFCDYFSHYFVPEGTTVDDFIQMIKEGKDEKKAETDPTESCLSQYWFEISSYHLTADH